MTLEYNQKSTSKLIFLDNISYRGDIDGLRAVAVLSVVGFHGFPATFGGGFIGVDIFFVISGYLISGIIFNSLNSSKFSFIDFYSRRIKRIFPALLLIIMFAYIVGWNTMFSLEFRSLNKHIAGGLGFLSNIFLWGESGYFDTAAETKPLLHLWSLAIEEQFYLLWPLLLWFCWRLRLTMMPIILSMAGISLFLSIYYVTSDPVSAFYLPHLRFWELLMGASLAYLTLHRKNIFSDDGIWLCNIVSCIGLSMIFVGFIFITKENKFPGWWALLPTIGTSLIITAGTEAWVNKVILSNRILVWFGLISFPLYLWHWPLLTFSRILVGTEPSVQTRLFLVGASIGLAWLTYRLIETPIRRSGNTRIFTGSLIVMSIALGGLSYFSFQEERQNGLPRNFLKINPLDTTGFDGRDDGFSINECGIKDRSQKMMFGVCVMDSREAPSYALFGDSKATAIYPGLIRTSLPNGRWLFLGGNGKNGTAVPILSNDYKYHSYQDLTNIALDNITNKPEIRVVVLVMATRSLFQLDNDYSIDDLPASQNYDTVFQGLSNVVKRLVAAGKKTVLLVDNPTFRDPTQCLKRTTNIDILNDFFKLDEKQECTLEVSKHLKLTEKYRYLLDQVKGINPEMISIFDPIPQLCDSQTGICYLHKNGRLLYEYTDHISDYGAGLVGRELNHFLSRF